MALSHSKRKPELKSSSYSDLEMMLQNIYKLLNFFNRYVFQNYDDDNDDYDDELFRGMVGRRKAFSLPLLEIATIANLWHSASRIWTCADAEFRFFWMKLCGSNNHYNTAPQILIPRKFICAIKPSVFSSSFF